MGPLFALLVDRTDAVARIDDAVTAARMHGGSAAAAVLLSLSFLSRSPFCLASSLGQTTPS